MIKLFNYLLPITLLTQPFLITQSLPEQVPLISQTEPHRFLENIDFLRVTRVEGKANVTVGQILLNASDTVNVEAGFITLQSNDGRLNLKVEASTIFYISSNNREERTITLYVQQGFIRATLNQTEGANPNRVIINTPGGYAAIRGTEISISVSPWRVQFSMISDEAQIDDDEILIQGNSLLRYADGSELLTELKEDYKVSLEQFNVDSVNRRFAIKARTDNQNSVLYNGEFIRVDSDGIFNLNIAMDDNLPVTLLTPFGTIIHFQVSNRGLI